MADRPDSEGGVFIPTERIYELLQDSIDRTNERLTEIRSDIRSMYEQNKEVKSDVADLKTRMRDVENTINKMPWTNLTAIFGAASGLILGYMKLTGK